MKSVEVITANVPFVSKTVVNLDATDAKKTVDEIQASFRRRETIGGLKLVES